MSDITHTYQYGSDSAHTVELTELEAFAVNNLRFLGYDEKGFGRLNSDVVDLDAYDRAAKKLNEYIESVGGSIPCEEGYLETHDVLTLIEK